MCRRNCGTVTISLENVHLEYQIWTHFAINSSIRVIAKDSDFNVI